MGRLGARLGSVVAAIGGLVFVLASSVALPGGSVLQALGWIAFGFAVILVLRSRTEPRPPRPEALRIYGLCVGAMVLAVLAGANLANRVLERPELVLCWVVVAVGAHFVPFAHAFHAPVFVPLGATMVGVGIVGGVLVLAGADDARLWCGVVAGFVLLAAVAWTAARPATSVASGH